MKKLVKGSLSLNLATVIRFARVGSKDAGGRLAATYRQINPFGDGQVDALAEPSGSDLALIPELPISALVRGRPTVKMDGTYTRF